MALGKSTLAKVIAGLEKPNKGQVLIDNINTLDKKSFLSIRRKIGMVFQNPENQILFNNVYDDIAFTMKNLKIDNCKEKIKQSLKSLNMQDFLNSEAYDLSLGQKQRITIAGVIATNPKYIILDEPTTMIDPNGKEDIYKMIKELKKQNYTIIYITNLIDEILMSDKIIVIERGKIINIFKKEEIFNEIEFFKKHDIKIPEIIELVYKLKNNGIDINMHNWEKEDIISELITTYSLLVKQRKV